jgi:ABC-type multidrug transport system fused ATPase/permease subunit
MQIRQDCSRYLSAFTQLLTIVDADMIYLLNKGKVIDSGSYPELVSRGRL